MCCFLPCMSALRKCLPNQNARETCTLVFTEIVRWITIAVPIMLSAWRYAEMYEYTRFIKVDDSKVKAQYFGIVFAIFFAASALIYVPVKIIYVKYWIKTRYTHGWRPSIVIYMICCALPCLIMIIVGFRRQKVFYLLCYYQMKLETCFELSCNMYSVLINIFFFNVRKHSSIGINHG